MIRIVHVKGPKEDVRNIIRVWTTITVIGKDNVEYSTLIKTSCDVTNLNDKEQQKMFRIVNELFNKNHTLDKTPKVKKSYFKKFW